MSRKEGEEVMTGGNQLMVSLQKAEGCSYTTRGETTNSVTVIEVGLLEKGKAAQLSMWGVEDCKEKQYQLGIH